MPVALARPAVHFFIHYYGCHFGQVRKLGVCVGRWRSCRIIFNIHALIFRLFSYRIFTNFSYLFCGTFLAKLSIHVGIFLIHSRYI